MKNVLLLLLAAMMLCNIAYSQSFNVIEPELQDVLNQEGNKLIKVNIILKDEMDAAQLKSLLTNTNDKEERRDAVVEELKAFSEKSQNDVMAILKSAESKDKVSKIESHWLANSINCTISKDLVYILSEHKDIAKIGLDVDKKLVCSETSFVMGFDEEATHNFAISSSCGEQESELSDDIVINLIDDAIIENNISLEIYPIPADGKIFINTKENIKDIKIYNITGVMVYENNEFENHVDISKLSNGIYFINIKTEKGNIIKKIIKQ